MPGFLRPLLLIVGVSAMLLGVLWILQGTGTMPVGFMAHHMQWAYRGIGLVVGGAVMAWVSRRL